jgi:hypothetical protein
VILLRGAQTYIVELGLPDIPGDVQGVDGTVNAEVRILMMCRVWMVR